MRSRAADLRFITHPAFGLGCVFAERLTDSGSVLDVWFPNDQRLRVILSDHVIAVDKPELPVELRKALRAAHSLYRGAHRKRVRQTPERPRRRRQDTKPEWRHTFEFAGHEDELAPADVEEDVSAE